MLVALAVRLRLWPLVLADRPTALGGQLPLWLQLLLIVHAE